MAKYKGHVGDVTVGGSSVGEKISFSIELSAATADASVMGSDWSNTTALQSSAEGTMEVLHDPGDAQQSALVAGATVTCVFFPAGNTTGLKSFSGDFVVSSVGISASVGDVVKTSVSVMNQGTVTTTTIS